MIRIKILWLVVSTLAWAGLANADVQERATQQFINFDECRLSSGQVLAPCKVGYRTYGALNSDKSNAVLVPTWFTGTAADHAYLASPAILNPEKYFIVMVDALANGVSSSPSNSATQANDKFPQISISDMVDSQHRLLTETLGVKSLHGIVGLSMGGMQALEWSVRYPGFAKKAVAAIASPRLASFDITLWSTRNRLLELYRKCQCAEALEALEGMTTLMAVPSKLTRDLPRDKADAALVARAKAKPMSVGKSWDLQRQAEAMISHNIARDLGNDLAQAAAKIKTKFLIIVSEDDRVVTPEPVLELANMLSAPVLELDQDCGHADPWCAPYAFAGAINGFINQD